jgi:D-beta-D-heptose 7-phosphate kinase/D-beta-D-heptose 1-phosphate adenosyltransferase
LKGIKALPKIVSRGEAASIRDAHAGRTLVFTNGCFDLLHVGHVRYLQAARGLGDLLVVGLNGDASVRQLKGPKRPLTPEAARAEVLAALSAVDHVVIFDEPRVTDLLADVRPDVYVKGGDYTLETLNREEMAVVERLGARVKLIPMVPGFSTTGILQKLGAG